jgi:hypothetical protein
MAPSLLHDNNTIQLMIYYGRFFKLAEILEWVESASNSGSGDAPEAEGSCRMLSGVGTARICFLSK